MRAARGSRILAELPSLLPPLVSILLGCSSAREGSQVDAGGCSDWPIRPGARLVSLDTESRFEVEPFFIQRGDHLAIAWEASGCDDRTKIGYARSGATGDLSPPRYLRSPDGQEASNVTLGWDSLGSLYASWASWTPGPDPAQPSVNPRDLRIQLARWPVGAAGFEAPVELSEPIAEQLYDKPWLLVTDDDTLIVTYGDLRRGGVWAASSTDGGGSFRRALIDPAMSNLAATCPDGRPGGAFVTYFANRTLRVAHTADGGATWSRPQTLAGATPTGDVAYQDPTCVAAGDEVWVAYGRTHDDFNMPVERLLAVEVAHGTLGASVPDTTTVVLDTAGRSTAADGRSDGGVGANFLLTPELARMADGRLGVAAYRSADEGTGTAAVVVAMSSDQGKSFAVERTIASGLSATLRRHVPNWLGDYFGWGATPAGLGVAFVDNGSGWSHIVFDKNVESTATRP
jgi:hypothetical protein